MTRPRRPVRWALLVVVLGLAAYAARIVVWRPAPLVGSAPADGRTRVGGVIHVHTTLSDGGGTPQEVIAAAKATGTRFLVITDHNNLDAKPFEGNRDGVLVIVGTEVSTNAGHVLGLGIDDPVYRFPGDVVDALEDIRDLGGVAYAAHPLSPRADFVWSGWDLHGWRGMELVNGDSVWRAAGWWRLARTLLSYRVNPRYALLTSLTPADDTLARFDEVLGQRDMVGIAGADAHSRVPIRKNWALRFPSYESLFGLIRNYVLLAAPLSGDAAADRRQVLDALAAGRSYIAVDAMAPGDAFAFDVTDGLRSWTMGDTVPPSTGLRVRVGGAFPAGARVRVLRDGKVLAESHDNPLVVPAETAGVYRSEIRLAGWSVPWIISNPIYVFDVSATDARRGRAAWPSPEPIPPTRLVLDSFEGPASVLSAEHDDRSKMPGAGLVPKAGHDNKGALAFPCDLGHPSDDHPDVYCAFISREPRDLSIYGGVTLWVRGTGSFRTWIQLRDENARSTDDGLEFWYTSVRTTPQWRQVVVPFDRFHSFNPHTDGRLDLDKVKQIVFVVDKGTLKTGAASRLELDDVGFY